MARRFRRSARGFSRRRQRKTAWFHDSATLATAVLPAIPLITTGSAATRAFGTTLMNTELSGRDALLSGGWLRGNVMISGTLTGIDPLFVLSLCVGLGIMENQAVASGLFTNTELISGGPQEDVALEQSRYYVLCCVDIPISLTRPGVARGHGQAYGDHENGGMIQTRDDVGVLWSFWCKIKSKRKLEGRSPSFPVLALSYLANDITLAPSSAGVLVEMHHVDYRATVTFPPGA